MSHSINGHFTPASLLKFAAPSIIMMMFMSLYTIIDGIFISRFVGSNALSSLNIVYPIINIVFAIGTMLGTGGNAIISRYMGEGKDKEAKECMTQFVVISLLISVVILVLTHMNLTSISRILGASDLLLADCDSYLSVVVSFAPAAILQCLFQSYFVTAGRPNLGLVLTMPFWTMFLSLFARWASAELPLPQVSVNPFRLSPACCFLHFRKVLCISPISDSISGSLDRPVIMVPLK